MSADEDWVGTGYEKAPGGSSGLFLRLKEKGESARLRLVSSAHRYLDIIEDQGENKEVKKVAWVAILKEVPAGSKEVHKRVVVFQGGPQIYGSIRTLMESDDWADPNLYDITVTRTEVQGSYYTVTPHAKPYGPLTAEEKALVQEADIHLDAIVRKQMRAKGFNVSEPVDSKEEAAQEEEPDPFAEDR